MGSKHCTYPCAVANTVRSLFWGNQVYINSYSFIDAQVYYNGQVTPQIFKSQSDITNPCVNDDDANPAHPKIGLGGKYPDGDNNEDPGTYATVSLDEISIWDHVQITEDEIRRVYQQDI